MANIINNLGQVLVGFRSPVLVTPPSSSTLWNSIYSVYNADSVGSSSLKTSLFAAYNGESNANDSFGSNNGTAQGGLTYTTGKIGNAFQFNGTNAYVSLPNNMFNSFTGDFSVSFWYKPSVLSGTKDMLSSFTEYLTNYYGFQISTGTNFYVIYICNGTLSYVTLQSSAGTAVVGTFTHVVITRKASTGTKIYVNGSLNSSNLSTMNPVFAPTNFNALGASKTIPTASNYANGILDEMNTWNKELTASEVTELYNSGNGAQYITDSFYKPTTSDALNTYNGTAQGGLTYGVGKVGTAFNFNGTTAYVRLPDDSLNINGNMSFSFWIKTINTTNYGAIIGNVQQARSPYGFTHGYEISMNAGYVYTSYRSGININKSLQSTTLISTNSWNHVVITYNPGTGTNGNPTGNKIYINGVLNVSGQTLDATGGSAIHYTSPMKACIGARNYSGTPSDFIPLSNLDAVSVWSKELSATEVTELYNAGNGKQYPN